MDAPLAASGPACASPRETGGAPTLGACAILTTQAAADSTATKPFRSPRMISPLMDTTAPWRDPPTLSRRRALDCQSPPSPPFEPRVDGSSTYEQDSRRSTGA